MKDRKRTPKGGVEDKRNAKVVYAGHQGGGSPFAHAAVEAGARTEARNAKVKSPFTTAASIKKAAKHDELRATAMQSERRKDNRNQMMGPGKKQDKPTKFDAKKAKDLSRIR